MAHTRTGGKPSECSGRYQPAEASGTPHPPIRGSEQRGPGDTSPGVLAEQLALRIPEPGRRTDRESRPA
jgi:hypothetical protein